MILWGAIWGAILSVFVSRWGEYEWIVGALFGALAGWTLRKAVRSEVARAEPRQTLTLKANPLDMAASTVATAQPVSETAVTEGAMPLAAASADAVRMPAAAAATAATAATAVTVTINEVAKSTASVVPASALEPQRVEPAEPNIIEALITRAKDWLLGGNTVARVGTVVLFIGLSFLAKWAADNALFPPEFRLAAIGVVGIALLVQGFRLARTHVDNATRSNYALLLQGAGVAVLYLTVFAAYKLYAMIPPLAAFSLMALVCALSTLLAILANAQTLALVGFAGAFATPILLSTGEGSHVALFSYYLLLNVAIGVVAWLRAWRALNLLGFLSTFIVATAWGALKYVPEQYASTQPFLIAFFTIYVLIGLFYALRHSPADSDANAEVNVKGHTLDGMLIFGTPIVAFALQTQLVAHIEYGAAISAVLLSAVYIVLAFSMRSRTHPLAQWLTLSYAALALIFATLAVPLAVDGKLTAAVWAIEGAGVFWLAMKQKRWMGQAFGAAMQLLAALAFVSAYENHVAATHAFANSHFIGTLMLAIGSFAISWWTYAASREQHALNANPTNDATAEAVRPKRSEGSDLGAANPSLHSGQTGALADTTLIDSASVLFFLVGFAWTLFGVWSEVLSSVLVMNDVTRFGWFTFAFVALTFCAFLAWRRTGLPSARYPVVVVLPFLIVCAALHIAINSRASLYFDLLLWPACFALHLIMLRGVDALAPQRWWRVVHAANTLLVILLIGGFLHRAANAGEVRYTDWAAVIMLFASTLTMMALASGRVWVDPATGWPLARFQREYALHAGLGVAALTLIGTLIVASTASGNTTPLPYVPLLNPVDLCAFMAVGSVALWLKRLRTSTLVSDAHALRGRIALGVLGFVAFIVVNTVWLRFAHHFKDIAWNGGALASSFFVQAGYSMLWTLMGVAAMVWAHKKVQRAVWQAGAALLALTVVKLLMVDLENSGGGERIVAFIGVGVLMVVVGYFAPMPPAVAKVAKATKLEEVNA